MSATSSQKIADFIARITNQTFWVTNNLCCENIQDAQEYKVVRHLNVVDL